MTDDNPKPSFPTTVDPENGQTVTGPPQSHVPLDMTPVPQRYALMPGEATDESGATVRVAFLRLESPMCTALLMLGEAAGLKLRDDLDALFGSGLSVVREFPQGLLAPGENGHRL